MMKKLILFVSLLLFIAKANAQNSAQDSLIFIEKLVQLAWDNSHDRIILGKGLGMAYKDVSIAKAEWLNKFSASGNLNEFTLNPDQYPERATFFPRYNFGLRVPFGDFITIPKNIRKAKDEVVIAEANVEKQKRMLTAEVLRRYQIYLTSKEILRLQSIALEDMYTAYLMAERKFKSNDATLQQYTENLEKYNSQKINRTMAENNYHIAKINLEELIGTRLEDVK